MVRQCFILLNNSLKLYLAPRRARCWPAPEGTAEGRRGELLSSCTPSTARSKLGDPWGPPLLDTVTRALPPLAVAPPLRVSWGFALWAGQFVREF